MVLFGIPLTYIFTAMAVVVFIAAGVKVYQAAMIARAPSTAFQNGMSTPVRITIGIIGLLLTALSAYALYIDFTYHHVISSYNKPGLFVLGLGIAVAMFYKRK